MDTSDLRTHIGVAIGTLLLIAVPTVIQLGVTLYSAFFFVPPAAIAGLAWLSHERPLRPSQCPAPVIEVASVPAAKV